MLDGTHVVGTIAQLPVADLIQMLLLTGKQAVITVTCEGLASQVWCAAGEIVDAESGRSRGAAALYRLLGFEHGALVAAWRDFSRPRTISGNPTRLLLEGARRKDESQALRGKLGGAQRRYRHAQAAPEPAALSAPELALLCSLAEARTVSDVLASSEQGELETLLLLARWIDSGVLVDAGPQATPTLAAVEASIAPRPAPNGQALAARWGESGAAALRQIRQFWLPVVLAALVLVPGGYLFGASSGQPLAQRAAGAAPSSTAPALVEAAPRSYPVQVQVEPADAQMVLDGEPPAQGHLEARLLHNGRVHELRVTASGFIPTSLRFLDTAPPQQLRLEPLSPPVCACDTPSGSASPEEQAGVSRKLYRRGGRGRVQTRGPVPAAKGPQLESLEPREPVVEVIH